LRLRLWMDFLKENYAKDSYWNAHE